MGKGRCSERVVDEKESRGKVEGCKDRNGVVKGPNDKGRGRPGGRGRRVKEEENVRGIFALESCRKIRKFEVYNVKLSVGTPNNASKFTTTSRCQEVSETPGAIHFIHTKSAS